MVRNVLAHVDKAIHSVSLVIGNIGIAVLVAMMLLTVADVFLRYVFNRPIMGGTEVTQFMLVSLSFLVLVYCTAFRAHVKVDILAERIPVKLQEVLEAVFLFCCLVLYSCMAWYSFLEAGHMHAVRQSSDILKIPAYPFYLLIAVTVVIVDLLLLIYLVKSIARLVKR